MEKLLKNMSCTIRKKKDPVQYSVTQEVEPVIECLSLVPSPLLALLPTSATTNTPTVTAA